MNALLRPRLEMKGIDTIGDTEYDTKTISEVSNVNIQLLADRGERRRVEGKIKMKSS